VKPKDIIKNNKEETKHEEESFGVSLRVPFSSYAGRMQ
jgi:hypothetical protein